MKKFLMLALLGAAGLAQAGQVSERSFSLLDQVGQPVFSIGSTAGLPCEPGFKPVGNDCEPLADFE